MTVDAMFIGPEAARLSERLGVTPRSAQRAVTEFGSEDAAEQAFRWCFARNVGLDDFTSFVGTLGRLKEFQKRERRIA